MSARPLLIELFTEELPPKALQRLGDAFCAGIADGLRARGLAGADAAVRGFCSPRRLAVRVDDVLHQAPDRAVELKGPSTKVALDAEGKPTQALLKWAEKQGATVEQLVRASDGKQECFFLRSTQRGETLAGAIDTLLVQALAKLPIPKLMEYQLADGCTNVSFVRPAHRLIVLHGADVVPAQVLGLHSGRTTQGHRFQSSGELTVPDAASYGHVLEREGRVLPDFATRRARIEALLREQARGLDASLGDESAVGPLLDEVCALVEWPAVYVGRFESEFLQVPQECLILTMRTNQKYFPLFDAQARLLPSFLIVSNMEVADPRFIIDGNQRVVRPRLADARFFFEQDKKTSLADRVPRLESVVYHAKLGTQGQRVERVRAIARDIAHALSVDAWTCDRAAMLAKADLLTGMVGEFPELQGVMGTYYARHDGEPDAVALAITEHYQPRFSGDALPASPAGTVVALADKLETLAGLFGIGQQPTGDKDPFALRRHAVGVLRMLIEKQLELPLDRLIAIAFGAFSGHVANAADALTAFFHDRLQGTLRERGASAGEVDAVISQAPTRLWLVPAQVDAVRAFSALPEAASLAAANKRIGNILRKSGAAAAAGVDPTLLTDPAERALFERIEALAPKVDSAMQARDFTGALTVLAGARDAVDQFFDGVMVMADDERVRGNRLALLARLHVMMNQVADLSKLSNA
jgi:glycyl-tRNA synthetase beta chain